jgi:Mn2+/Fe2+ NRAMP family transporter
MNNIQLKRFDTVLTGVISGLILPVIIYFILYFTKIQDISSTLFSNHLVISNLIPVILSHCVLPNLILFFIFNGTDWMRAAKGIVIVTVVMTAIIFLLKLAFSIL